VGSAASDGLAQISGNAGIGTATVAWTGPSSGSVTADSNGDFTTTGLTPGTYTITPSLTGFAFTPPSQIEVVSSTNIFGVNFTATNAFSISGNAGVAGATVSYSGTASGSVTADGSGDYSIPDLADGPYTITPSLTGYTFSPTSANETVADADITGVDFTATPIAPTVYSVIDSRDYGNFPNHAVDVQGTQTYTVPAVDSRAAGAPVDSRAAGAPVDSRKKAPQNSRTFPPFSS
jgi:hypothetical protein